MKRIDKLISLIRHFFISRQPFILFSLIVIGGLGFLSQFPYLNLFLTFDRILLIYWIVTVILFQLSERTSFLLAIIFLFLALVLSFLSLNFAAEQAGNIIYYLLAIGFLQSFWSYLKKMEIQK